jgi:hypothetical protein
MIWGNITCHSNDNLIQRIKFVFNFLKNQEEETDENFVASRGWFEKFKK